MITFDEIEHPQRRFERQVRQPVAFFLRTSGYSNLTSSL
jgi:hypothetical protein